MHNLLQNKNYDNNYGFLVDFEEMENIYKQDVPCRYLGIYTTNVIE